MRPDGLRCTSDQMTDGGDDVPVAMEATSPARLARVEDEGHAIFPKTRERAVVSRSRPGRNRLSKASRTRPDPTSTPEMSCFASWERRLRSSKSTSICKKLHPNEFLKTAKRQPIESTILSSTLCKTNPAFKK